jgi:hypothetical protein
MEKSSIKNLDIPKVNRHSKLETSFNIGYQNQRREGKQTTLSDFIK